MAAPNPQNSGAELLKQSASDGKEANGESANGSVEKLAFPIPQPMREDQVQNAVRFLSHPKVRGSPVIYRRSFLEKKGLTNEEIDEAFRRVPDSMPSASSVESNVANPDTHPKQSTAIQSHTSVQALQSATAPIGGGPMVPMVKPSFRWHHVLFAVGVIVASGAGTAALFKRMVVPRLKAWIRKVVAQGDSSEKEEKPSSRFTEEAVEAAKEAASAAAIAAKASQELLSSKSEEKKYLEAFMRALEVQVKEMKSMGSAIRKLEGRKEDGFSQHDKLMEEHSQSTTRNGPPVSSPWRTSQVMTMGQREEKPPGIKPWELGQHPQQRPSYTSQPPPIDEGSKAEDQDVYYGHPAQLNGKAHDASDPWWRKKTVKISEIEPNSEDPRATPYGPGAADERPTQRRWVPPQPPAVVMPEAVAAIRHLKPSVVKQQSGDERSAASSEDGEDGALKVPKLAVEADNANGNAGMGIIQSEIEEE